MSWLIGRKVDDREVTENGWAGCGITLGGRTELTFTHSNGTTLSRITL